jgi:hypothetical protein
VPSKGPWALEDEGDIFLPNVGNHLSNDAVPHLRRPESKIATTSYSYLIGLEKDEKHLTVPIITLCFCSVFSQYFLRHNFPFTALTVIASEPRVL